jgi:hypothetical protein
MNSLEMANDMGRHFGLGVKLGGKLPVKPLSSL